MLTTNKFFYKTNSRVWKDCYKRFLLKQKYTSKYTKIDRYIKAADDDRQPYLEDGLRWHDVVERGVEFEGCESAGVLEPRVRQEVDLVGNPTARDGQIKVLERADYVKLPLCNIGVSQNYKCKPLLSTESRQKKLCRLHLRCVQSIWSRAES